MCMFMFRKMKFFLFSLINRSGSDLSGRDRLKCWLCTWRTICVNLELWDIQQILPGPNVHPYNGLPVPSAQSPAPAHSYSPTLLTSHSCTTTTGEESTVAHGWLVSKMADYEISRFDISLVLVVFQFDKYPSKIDGLFRHPVSFFKHLLSFQICCQYSRSLRCFQFVIY